MWLYKTEMLLRHAWQFGLVWLHAYDSKQCIVCYAVVGACGCALANIVQHESQRISNGRSCIKENV